MPFNGSGTFTRLRSWVNDANSSVNIEPDLHDSEDDGFATGLTNCLTKDGQTTPTAHIPLGGFKITGLGDATAATDALNRQFADARYLQSGALYMPMGGRLTLSTGVGVMATTISGATSHYYTPYTGRQLMLYNGTDFSPADFGGELSQVTTDNTKSPAAVAADKNYDIFGWLDNATYRATRGPAWSTDTSRGTGAGTSELELIEGLYVNKVAITNGPAAQRGTYLGTIRSNGSSQFDWTLGTNAGNGGAAKLGVWNAYNRRLVSTMVGDTTDSWTYGTASWRASNNSATNRVSFVQGLGEDFIQVMHSGITQFSAGAPIVGVGIDSTTAFSGSVGAQGASAAVTVNATYSGIPGAGWHYASGIEYAVAGNAVFYGDAGTSTYQSGLHFKGMF